MIVYVQSAQEIDGCQCLPHNGQLTPAAIQN